MQFIKKNPIEPANWNHWFEVLPARRTYDYRADSSALPLLTEAKKHLLNEQSFLCAYCQSKLTESSASIEHVTPKSKNIGYSTHYHNLVAVCKNPVTDPQTDRKHCDKARENILIPPIIFYNDADCTSTSANRFFMAFAGGIIEAKSTLKLFERQQVDSFIYILNLNHAALVKERKKHIDNIVDIRMKQPKPKQKAYLESEYRRILNNQALAHRQFYLIYLAGQLGM